MHRLLEEIYEEIMSRTPTNKTEQEGKQMHRLLEEIDKEAQRRAWLATRDLLIMAAIGMASIIFWTIIAALVYL